MAIPFLRMPRTSGEIARAKPVKAPFYREAKRSGSRIAVLFESSSPVMENFDIRNRT
jgi:hypothetical protein